MDRWILTLTGRQDWVDTATRNNLTNRDTTQRDSAFTGRAALLYASAVGLSPYFSYSTSFLPTLGNFAPARGGNPFVPATGEQFEAGLKFQPPGTNGLITGTFYQVSQQNALSTDPLNVGFSIQTGEVRSRGFELEAAASLAGGLNLIAAWTVQDVEITKSTTNNLGLRPLAVPSHMAALWGDYSYRVSDDLTLGLGGGVRYIGNTLGNNTPGPGRPVFNVPSYTVFDAMVRADWRQWRLQLNAFNLGDEAYIQACQGSCYYGPGRTVYATLAYRW